MTQYCPELFKNIYIEKQNQQQVKLGFCCQSETTKPTDQVSFDHEFLVQGRQYFIQNNKLPDACSICTNLESNGADSLRTRLLKNYDYNHHLNSNLKSIHYNCDPICNLKCIICTSQYSSSWIEDEIALGRRTDLQIRPTKHNKLLWDLNLENLQFIYFNGGEPLLTNDHINLLEKIDPVKAKHTDIVYSTNATIFPSEKLLDLWKKFENVKLQFSIDATSKAIEYIRFPSSWSLITDNIKKLQQLGIDNLSFSLAPNIGLHNLFYLEDLLDWGLQSNLPIIPFPTGHTFSISNLPEHLKSNALDVLLNLQLQYQDYTDLETFINLVKSINKPDLNWISYLQDLDRLRNTNWKVSLDKLYNQDKKFFDSFNL